MTGTTRKESPLNATGSPRTPATSPARRILVGLAIVVLVSAAGFVTWRGVTRTGAASPNLLAVTGGAGDEQVVRITVEGMTCAGCAETVANEIRKVDGVVDCHIDRDKGIAEVRLAREGVSTAVLLAAVEDAGYTASLTP